MTFFFSAAEERKKGNKEGDIGAPSPAASSS